MQSPSAIAQEDRHRGVVKVRRNNIRVAIVAEICRAKSLIRTMPCWEELSRRLQSTRPISRQNLDLIVTPTVRGHIEFPVRVEVAHGNAMRMRMRVNIDR